jgi:ketosteroid isomerase-like protein
MEFLNAEYRVEGSVVLCSGKWRYTMPMPEGEPMVMEGRFTDVKAKRDGKMVIIMDHASVPMPAPEMSEMH